MLENIFHLTRKLKSFYYDDSVMGKTAKRKCIDSKVDGQKAGSGYVKKSREGTDTCRPKCTPESTEAEARKIGELWMK